MTDRPRLANRRRDTPLFRPLFLSDSSDSLSPRAHLHVVGMLRFVSDINQQSLPIPFYSVLLSISVFMALSTVFHSINYPDNSPFSLSVVPILSVPCWSFQLYVSLWKSPPALSPRAHFHVVGMLPFVCFFFFLHNPTELAHSVLFCSCVYFRLMVLSAVFHYMNSPDNSPLSRSVLPILFLPFSSFQLYISLRKSPSALM